MADAGTPLRGRDAVLAKIAARLDQVCDGPVAILLEGVAGIGKTAVWTAGLDVAEAHGYRVLRSRPVRAEARLAFAGLGDLLSGVANSELAALPATQADAIDAALLRSEQATADHRAVAVAVTGLLHEIAAHRPVVIAVDDVQWLDAPTRRVLEFVARRLDHAQIGIVAARRREPGARLIGTSTLKRALENMPHDFLSLGPLATDDMVKVLSGEPEIDLPRATLNHVVQASGGNPLYALELARSLRSEQMRVPGEPLPIPDSLRGLVRRRLQPLDESSREALLLLALLGRPRADVVTRVLAHAAGSLKVARERGLVEDDGDHVRFTHPLLASTVIHEADPDHRRAAHRQLAEVVDDLEERARHLALSSEAPDETVAAELEAAATVARARGAPEAAAELLQLAVSLTPASRADQRHRLTMAAATDLFSAGDGGHARTLLEGLIATLEPGRGRAEALNLLATIRFTGDSATDAMVLLEQALTEVRDDPLLTMSFELTAVFIHTTIGDYNRANAHLARAREIATQLALTEALEAIRAFELMFQSPLDQDSEAWESTADVPLPGGVAFVRAQGLFWRGDLDEARTILEVLRTEALAAGDDAMLSLVQLYLMRVETWSGRFARVREHGDDALAITEVTGRDVLRAMVVSVALHVQALQEPEAEVRSAIAAGIALAERTGALSAIPDMQSALGELLLSTGDGEGAAAALRDARERMVAMGIDHPVGLRFLGEEIDALVGCGRLDDADDCLALFPTIGAAAEVPWIRAIHARSRALVAASRGESEAAIADLELALELQRATPMKLDIARTLLVDGRVRRRCKQWGSARRSLTEALAVFEELAMPHWAAQARAELGRVGGRQPLGDELSATEQRVAALVATGRTNREVARELFLSQSTVEWHLRRIYRKLGVRNRAELSATRARANEG